MPTRCLLPLLLALTTASGQGLVNGSFEEDADGDGTADGWQFSGDAGVQATLRREQLRDGTFCQVLTCTAYVRRGAASHAMLAQYDTLELQQGQWYRLTVRLRGSLPGGAIDLAISDTTAWRNLGLNDSAMVGPTWREHVSLFQATDDSPEHLRLQMWWAGIGEVWFDNVTLEPIDRPKGLRTERVTPTDSPNLLPNGGFEAGEAGWGSVTDVPGWGGNLNQLVGEVIDQGAHAGQRCLRITVDEAHLQTVWFDYYDLVQVPVRKPLAAHRGWISVTPGQEYTLSAWLRAEPAGTPVVLRAVMSQGRSSDGTVTATGAWQRYSMTFTAASDQVYACFGPNAEQDVTLWVDDVMLNAGAEPLDHAPHAPLTIGVQPLRHGALYAADKPAGLKLEVANESGADRTAELTLTLTDAAGTVVEEHRESVAVAAGTHRAVTWHRNLARGFYRLTVTADGAVVVPPRPLRLAVLDPNTRDDTVCGMNHGYPTGDLLEASKRIGLGWFRDWSLKWQTVEPEQGTFDFSGTDAQIDRVREHDLRIIGLLPFPSSVWSSSDQQPAGNSYDGRRHQVAQAPRDPAWMTSYVTHTVEHYRGRIAAYEFFNEPVYTSYSFPQKDGYTVADYVKWLKLAVAAARQADPDAFMIGGIQNLPGPMSTEFVEQGGLEPIDAISIHHYPGKSSPENVIEPLTKLRAAMAAAGHAEMPIYWTEGAYYADDDKPREPYTGDWLKELPSEALATAYMVRLNTILCAYNTRRIIYHSGTPGAINAETLSGIFFEYDAAPRMMAPALAAFNRLISPDFVSHGAVKEGPEEYRYRFDSDGRTVIVAWRAVGELDRTAPAGWTMLDMFGQPVDEGGTNFGPVYLVGPRARMEAPAL